MKFSIFLGALSLLLTMSFSPLMADKCVSCATGSSCQQCRLDGDKDNQQNRKKCQQLGCKITGTTSCSRAANVKVCNK